MLLLPFNNIFSFSHPRKLTFCNIFLAATFLLAPLKNCQVLTWHFFFFFHLKGPKSQPCILQFLKVYFSPVGGSIFLSGEGLQGFVYRWWGGEGCDLRLQGFWGRWRAVEPTWQQNQVGSLLEHLWMKRDFKRHSLHKLKDYFWEVFGDTVQRTMFVRWMFFSTSKLSKDLISLRNTSIWHSPTPTPSSSP